jgi:hypothetical protein
MLVINLIEAYALLVKHKKEKHDFKYDCDYFLITILYQTTMWYVINNFSPLYNPSRCLQEFWHKITKLDKDLTGKVNLNSDSSNIFWYTLWLLDFDSIKIMEKFESFLQFSHENPDFYSYLPSGIWR